MWRGTSGLTSCLAPSRTNSSCVHLPRPRNSGPRRPSGFADCPQTVLKGWVYIKATQLLTLLAKRKTTGCFCAEHQGTPLPSDHIKTRHPVNRKTYLFGGICGGDVGFRTPGVIRLQRHGGNGSAPASSRARSEALTDKALALARGRERPICFNTRRQRRGRSCLGLGSLTQPSLLEKAVTDSANPQCPWRGALLLPYLPFGPCRLHHTGLLPASSTLPHGALRPLLPWAAGSPRTALGPPSRGQARHTQARGSCHGTDQRRGTEYRVHRAGRRDPAPRVTLTGARGRRWCWGQRDA